MKSIIATGLFVSLGYFGAYIVTEAVANITQVVNYHYYVVYSFNVAMPDISFIRLNI